MNSKTSKHFLALVTLLLLWALTACGKADAPPRSDAPAGEVEAVEGAVTAQRSAEAKPRLLAVRAPVFADDTVTTPPNSAVTIRLLHNLAQWHLEGGLSKRVDQSAAFAAPRDAAPQPLANKPEATVTASAGRHSEHEAAGSAESALRAPEPTPAAVAAPAPAPSAELPAERVAAKAAARPAKGGGREVAAKLSDNKLFDKSLDEPVRSPSPPSGPVAGKSGGSGTGGAATKGEQDGLRKSGDYGDVEVAKAQLQAAPEALRSELTALMNKLKAAMAKCAEPVVAQGGEVPSTVKVTLTLGTEGLFTRADVDGLSGSAAQCVKARWLSARGLPKVEAPVELSVIYTLRLADM